MVVVQDFGDLTSIKLAPTGAGDATRGIFFGGESLWVVIIQ